MSKLKSSILRLVDEIESSTKKPVHISDINEKLNFVGSRINQMLWQYAKEGYFKKSKQGNRSLYRLSPKGKSELAEAIKSNDFLLDQDFISWAKGETDLISQKAMPKAKAKSAPRAYSGSALSAIESIANVIDENERLINTLRSIKSQIDFILKEHDGNVSEVSNI